MDDFQVDVLVVGAGNAAACAALAAREHGATVAMLEAAPQEERGGNSSYTAGAMRVVFNGVDDLVQLYDLTEDEKRDVDFGKLQKRGGFTWREIDVDSDAEIRRRYTDEVPVVFINGRKSFKYRLDEQEFLRKLGA